MWSCSAVARRLARWGALAAILAVAGCGFRPLYQKGGVTAARTSEIKIDAIADRTGQILRNHLEERLHPHGVAETSKYILQVELKESTKNLALRLDEVATRANLTIDARFTLTATKDGKRVTGGNARTTVSYNLLREDFATISARDAARRRGAKQLADEIWTRLAIYLSREQAATGQPAPRGKAAN